MISNSTEYEKDPQYTAGEYHHLMTDSIQQHIKQLVTLYADFGYPLDADQIHQLLSVPIEKQTLRSELENMVHLEVLVHHTNGWYATAGNAPLFELRSKREKIAQTKRLILTRFCNFAKKISYIDSIVLTGSMAIGNVRDEDDIDVMIITASHTMFIARLFTYVLVRMLGMKRGRTIAVQPDTICTNLWIDSTDLMVIPEKQTLYSARELASAQVIFDRNDTFARFITSNQWISAFLPNWRMPAHERVSYDNRAHMVTRLVNKILGILQLAYMRPHITREKVSYTQLWFHPILRDFQHR